MGDLFLTELFFTDAGAFMAVALGLLAFAIGRFVGRYWGRPGVFKCARCQAIRILHDEYFVCHCCGHTVGHDITYTIEKEGKVPPKSKSIIHELGLAEEENRREKANGKDAH